MNFSNYRFTLDIQRAQAQVSIPVRYRDTGHCLYITLSDGGQPYRIGEGCRVVFYALKPNGLPLFNDCYIEDEGTVVRYDFNAYTASVAGVHRCEVRVTDKNGRVITSPSFIMVVDERVVFDDDIITEEDRDTLLALDVIAGEQNRRTAEFERIEAENKRVDNELDRKAAELLREEAEAERVSAEEERVKAESERVKAESERGQELIGVNETIANHEDRISVNEDDISYTRDRVNGLMDIITTAIKKANNNASRLTSIERYLGGEFFVVDNSFNYERDVPENALAKAKINSIGGMTYKSKNLYDGEQDISCSGSAVTEIIFEKNITEPVTISFRYSGSVKFPGAEMVKVLLNDGTVRYVALSEGEGHFDNLSSVVLINNPKLSGTLYDIQIEYGDVRTEFEPYYEGLRDTKVAQILCDSNLLRVNDFVHRQTDTMPSGKDRAISAFIPFKDPIYVKANNIPRGYMYEIEYYKSPEYTSSAVGGNSGWITDTNSRVANQYNDVEHEVKYIAILVGAERNPGVTLEVTREVIESFDFQVTYDSGSTYVGDLTVPEEVRNLQNYGAGINGGCYNYLNYSQTNSWKYYRHVGSVDLSTLDWFYDSGARVFTAPLITAKIDTLNLLSDMYATSKYSSATSSPDMSIYGRSQDGLGSIGVKNSNYTDAAEFKAAMSGVIVYYELATPVVIDVSEYMKTNLINVEGGSHLTARSNTNKPVWYSAKYLVSYKEEDK